MYLNFCTFHPKHCSVTLTTKLNIPLACGCHHKREAKHYNNVLVPLIIQILVKQTNTTSSPTTNITSTSTTYNTTTTSNFNTTTITTMTPTKNTCTYYNYYYNYYYD